jgi:uncharacterized 2Fe-2S/4Fe-4S cluster protein (DUF4445 family)
MTAIAIDFEPTEMRLICDEPILLLVAAQRTGVPLEAVCGSKATWRCVISVIAK